MLTSQVAGTVALVESHSGQAVRAGEALFRIDSPALQGQLLESERALGALKDDYLQVASRLDAHRAEQTERLRTRIARLDAQASSLRASVAYFGRRLKADAGLHEKGLLSILALEEARDALAQAKRQLVGAEVSLDQVRQEAASFESHGEEDLWQRQQAQRNAQNRRDSLAFLLDQTIVRAPEDGTVEALLVKLGEAIQPGQVVGKLIPAGSALQVVSFLAERDRAFVKPGDEVQLELDQLPYAEYGTLRAKVVRISDDLASPFEVREALGEDQKLDAPTYRVELDIEDARAAVAAGARLRTGMLMNVRYELRRQRLVTLVLDPLRRWVR
jgi:membrane fusion protein